MQQLPKPVPRDHDELVRDIQSGICQIPRFQRDFVWPKEQAARLIDSVIKGFPIGAFILWKTKERMGAHKKFGGVILETPPESDFVHYVLDGQQRLTSLFLAVRGIALDGDNPGKDYGRLYADLNPEKSWDGDDALCVTEKPTVGIPIHQLVAGDWPAMRALEDRHGRDAAGLANRMREAVTRYKFATIEVQDLPLETVAEMFTRINTGGRELTLFEIVNAKVYQEGEVREGEVVRRAFDLEEEINELTEELGRVSYDTLTDSKPVVLQAAAAIIGRDVRKKTILNIRRDAFIDEWDETAECLRLAVDKMRDYFCVKASKLLPYPALLAPVAYFYRLNKKRQPDNPQMRQISQFFFRAAFSRRYSSAVETKMNQDLRLMEKIAERKPVSVAEAIPLDNETEEFFVRRLKGDFRTGDAFVKAVLCIMAERGPKRLSDNSPVRLDNSGLHRSTSMNYHHFFPKSRVRGDSRANAVANIVLVDDYLNKRVIGSKMPSKYIGDFRRENPDGIAAALDSHFVGMGDFVDESGNDDFGRFLDKRACRLARVILQKIGAESGEAATERSMQGKPSAAPKPENGNGKKSDGGKPNLVLRAREVPPSGVATRIHSVGLPFELEARATPEKARAAAVDRVKDLAENGKFADLIECAFPSGETVRWATHQAALDALLGLPKPPSGLEKALLPVNGVRPLIELAFWTRAPVKSRPEFGYKPAAPKGEWAMCLVVGDDSESSRASGHITHMPTRSFFRFWQDTCDEPGADGKFKPSVMMSHRGDGVKSNAAWESLLKDAPKQMARLLAMMSEDPEL